MAATFPASPSNGDTVTVGRRKFVFNGTKNAWEKISSNPVISAVSDANISGELDAGSVTAGTADIVNANISGTLDAASATISSDFSVDSNTFFVDASTNQVGIGTSSPTATLDVKGDGGLYVNTDSNGIGAKIKFSDQSSGSQYGTLKYVHFNSESFGAGNAFIFDSSESSMNVKVYGDVIADGFSGDGSQLTGINSGLQTIFKTMCINENVNFGSFTKGTIFNTSPDINQGGFTVTSTDITVPEDGIYLCSFNFRLQSPNYRTNILSSWGVNNVNQGEYSASAYIRAANGHNESSLHYTTIFDLSANDTLQVYFQREARSATVTLLGSSSTVSIIKIG